MTTDKDRQDHPHPTVNNRLALSTSKLNDPNRVKSCETELVNILSIRSRLSSSGKGSSS